MLTSRNWFVALPLLCTLSLVAATCQDTCQSGSSGQWLSSIRLSNVGARTITFTWDADPIFDPDVYVVQFRERDTQFFTNSLELNDNLTYVVESLTPSTNYEGQVCRAMRRSSADDCGNCLICFLTTEAQEPPSAPREIHVTANGPETLTVSWTTPEIVNGGIDTYNVSCNFSQTGQVAFRRKVPSSSGNLVTVVSFLTPDTEYDCEVTATNSFGTSLAAMAQGVTPPRTKIPGDLLLVYSNDVRYAKLTEDSVSSNVLTMDNPVLLNTSTTLIGIDYHFYRDEIYMMTPTSLTRMRVQLSENFDLSRLSDPETVVMLSSAITNGAIAVDWVNNDIYWVERVQSQAGSTIRRALINDNGTVSESHCVIQFASNEVLHIVVDPVRGYFYWSDDNGIYRVELNSVRVSGSQCPNEIPSNTTVVTNLFLQTFTIESDGRIYFVGYSNCFRNTDPPTNQSLLSTDSNAQASFPHLGVGSVNTMDSFSQVVFIPSGSTFLLSVDTSEAASCPRPVSFTASATSEQVQVVRTYRSVKQPLPVPPTPPTRIRVNTTSTTASVTWDAPLFVGNLYSSSAYSSWTYVLTYHDIVTPSTQLSQNTTLLTTTLEGLQPGTVYGLNVSAVGPGGQQDIPQQLVFTTKASGSDSSLLLVATEGGVFQSGSDGDQAVLIGGGLSSESNGVTYDTYSDEYYWAIQGGQGSIYTSNSTLLSNARRLIDFRDNPFQLKFDWVARRLFWVEDGDTSRGPKRIMFFDLEEQDEDPQTFAEVSNIQAMALDSINGILFWTESNTIQMKILSGLALPMCFEPPTTPSALAVDVDRRRLYWLSLVSNSEVLSVNQLEYSTTECMESISTLEIPALTFSSSPTVLTYAADTLFIGSLSSNEVYSVAADLAAVGDDQSLAFGSIRSSTNVRDVFVITTSVQPLPDSLPPQTRQAAVLTPTVAAPVPRLGDASTRFSIEIEWDAAPPLDVARDSPILYQLDYSLRLSGEENAGPLTSVVTASTSQTVTSQQPLTLATVNASVTVFSLWYRGTSSPFTTFESLPDLPGHVSNLRAYTYQPTLSETELTALVIWDEPDFVVTTYRVRMFDTNGMELYNSDVDDSTCLSQHTLILYQPTTNETQYSILLRDCNVYDVSYPNPGTYEIEITPVNPSGQGNTSRVTVSINAPDYPQQIIGLVDSGIQSSGQGITFSASSASNSPGHIAVDTIGRMVYWFHPSTRIICRQSLNGGEIDYFILLPQDTELLALSFEWVAMELYYIVAEDTSRRIVVYKVPAINRNALTQVLPNLQDTVNPGAQVQMSVDPFRGYLYYLVADSTSSLHVLDLRQESASASSVLSGARSRRQTSGNSLSDLSLAPALALEPTTGDLLVSDAASGNILSCSLNCSGSVLSCSSNCAVLVDNQQLLGGNTEIGLPATIIALNEQRIYWTSISSDRVFAVDRSNLMSLINFAGINASAVLTLSPGQQPIPSDETCLSPQQLSGSFGERLRVNLDTVNKTNTTLLVRWDVPRLVGCEDVVFSYPALTYGVELQRGMMTLLGYPVFTVDNYFLIENLEPFTDYMVEIKGCNKYTGRTFVTDSLFGIAVNLKTLEGVPDRPRGLQPIEFGTSNVNLTWDEPDNIRGPKTIYYVQLSGNEVQTNDTTIVLMKEDGVIPGARQTIGVIVSNGVLNSTTALVEVIPWPLAPAPTILAVTNTSLNVSVQLTQPGVIYDPIEEIGVELCILPNGSMDCTRCTGLITRDPQQVDESTTLEFNFTELLAHTNYCLRGVGTYMVVEGVDMPEVTAGEYTILTTLAGRPDAPSIEIDETNRELLLWNIPNSRGRSIDLYNVIAMQTDAPSADEITIPRSTTSINLQEQTELEVGVAFDIQVVARNDIGDSDRSNTVTFTRLSDSSPLSDSAIAGIAVGGVVGLLILIVVVVIIVFVIVCCCGRSGKRDLKSLSYMYGPDHELSNLRHAYRHAQANNPHYTWSMDDYVCTDEDLEILNKFPRQDLKLETFIDRGEFGEVFQGTAIDILGEGTGPTPVAVKTLRKGTTLEEQRKFLSEASLMSHFNHPNILKVLGVCVDNDPVYIILELMPAGDLLKFLRDAKRDHGPTLLTLAEQIQVALDVAHGCRYLEQQHFIHRDIAARNCLVSSRGADRVVKIGDFGLAKDLYSSDYYQVEGQRKLPVRWMAPEALLQGKFTIESDTWSYGVLLWEIMTLGNQPYPGRINQEVLQYVTGGGRLDRPEKCPGKIYHVMQNCWKRYSSERVHFEKIVEVLTNFLDRLKRPDSVYYSDSDSDEGGDNLHRQSSGKTPTRTPSIRSGIINLARSGSMKLRNSLRRHGSVHRRDDHAVSQISVSSSENLIASEEGNAFRERGPF